jgi:hypothetical protein
MITITELRQRDRDEHDLFLAEWHDLGTELVVRKVKFLTTEYVIRS